MSEIGNVTAEIFVTFMLFYLIAYLKMDPKGRLSSQIHFLVPLGITYSDSLHCGNAFDQTHILEYVIYDIGIIR